MDLWAKVDSRVEVDSRAESCAESATRAEVDSRACDTKVDSRLEGLESSCIDLANACLKADSRFAVLAVRVAILSWASTLPFARNMASLRIFSTS